MKTSPTGAALEPEQATYAFGVRVDNTRGEHALEKIRGFITRRDSLRTKEVFFSNVHSIQLARQDSKFRGCLNQADLVLPDGAGLHLWGKLFGAPIVENLNGTDFTPKLLKEAASRKWSVYLLGARPEVVEACRKRLRERFPNLRVAGAHDGHFTPEGEQFILSDINEKHPSILLVALGSPLQEEWIARNARRLNVGVCLAVGGLFDFIAGIRKRAPYWMRATRIEWLYRFLQDPRSKWNRVVVEIPAFLLDLAALRLLLPKFDPLLKHQAFFS